MAITHFGSPRFERRYIRNTAAQPLAGVYGLTLIQDGITVDLEKLGYTVTQFIDEGYSMDWINEELDDLDGTVDLGSSLSPRRLTVSMVFTAHSRDMDALKTHQLRKIFSKRNLMTLRVKPESEKEIIVRRTGNISISQPDGSYLREATVQLSAPSPYWQSIKPAFQPFEVGNGLAADIVDLSRAQTDTIPAGVESQIFYNEGDAAIDPRSIHTPLKIIVSGGVNPKANFILRNTATGTSVQLSGLTDAQAKGTITFDGVRVYNGSGTSPSQSLFSKSNRTVLTMAEGRNVIQVIGGTTATTVKFETKYFYD